MLDDVLAGNPKNRKITKETKKYEKENILVVPKTLSLEQGGRGGRRERLWRLAGE